MPVSYINSNQRLEIDLCLVAKPNQSQQAGLRRAQNKGANGLVLLVMGALGIVYGDIGTSPLYTIQVCFSKTAGVAVEAANVVGVISLIIWALVVIVSIKYLIVIMRADLDGEGGILALTTLVCSKRSKARSNVWLLPLGLFGAALLLGDSMITPAISVLTL